jgi:hypothetical protein
MIVVSISIEIKRKIVGLVRSSKLPLSEQEMLELGINSFTEYLSFLDKYLGKNTFSKAIFKRKKKCNIKC